MKIILNNGIIKNFEKGSKTVISILLSSIFILLILTLLNYSNFSNTQVVMFFLSLHMYYIILKIYQNDNIIFPVLFFGVAFRIFLIYFDQQCQHIFLLPNSGFDTELFFLTGIKISRNIELLSVDIYGGLYTKFLGLLFYMVGEYRLVGHYINLIFGIATLLTTWEIFKLISVNVNSNQNPKIFLTFLTFIPHLAVYSSILLREIFIIFFLTLSYYQFVCWTLTESKYFFLKSVASVVIASLFHPGVVSILSGYIFTKVYYDFSNESYDYSFKNHLKIVVLSFFSFFLFIKLRHNIYKFDQLRSMGDLYRIFNKGRGNSEYLVNLRVDNIWTFVLYIPVKMFYFLVSPLPHTWRGFGDLLAFGLNSSVYCIVLIKSIKNKNSNVFYKTLTISLLAFTLFFGIGVKNTGTAIRHRTKVLPLFIIYYYLTFVSQSKEI